MAAGISTVNRATMEKIVVVVFESLYGATVTPFERLDGKTPVLDAHLRELITIITQRYLSVLRFCR